MYTLGIRDHFMIAHSFQGEVFGLAQKLHGATYVVDLELHRPDLDNDGVVVDIGLASRVLKEVLAELNYHNLDEEPAFAGQNTTTEYLARAIFERVAARVRAGALESNAQGLTAMKVTLRESHIAWASYTGPLKPSEQT